MTIIYLILVALGFLIILRTITLLFFAEIGRKQDLIKHIYKSGTDFQIAIVIPYLDSRKIVAFQELLDALDKQDYPKNRTGIHVVATEDSAFGLPNPEDMPDNVKLWTYPARNAPRGQLVSWLVERLLAAGGPSKLFVFMDADDIVRPDFLRNVTTRAFDCFAMQGYIALKRPPRGPVATVAALSARLINRIENAGRFHVGLSCKLMNSGWVVRQELLEMIPFRQGHDIDNQEYTILLNLNGYRINWAPNVVVYKDERVDFTSLMKDVAHSFVNRLRLTFKYTPQLLLHSFTRLDFNLLDQAWNCIKPPNFMIGFIAVAGALFLMGFPLFPGSFYYWSIFALVFWSTQLIGLAVARCSFKDVLAFIAITPIVYLTGVMTFPLFLLMAFGESMLQRGGHPRKGRIGKRFDESKPSKTSGIKTQRLLPSLKADDADEEMDGNVELDAPLPTNRSRFPKTPIQSSSSGVASTSRLAATDFARVFEDQMRAPEPTAAPVATRSQPTVAGNIPNTLGPTVVELPITNGKNSVMCTIETLIDRDASGATRYALVFAYKNLSFKTQQYPIVDQAYYELQTKIQSKGFSLLSCGSCAYFYRPTAGNLQGVAKDHGFCLYGKLGKEVNLATDAVTVISPHCQGYTDMAQRPGKVAEWQNSVQQVPLR